MDIIKGAPTPGMSYDPNPTCSYTMRKEYGDLVGTAEARQVAAATMDPCEFLFQLKQEGKFNREFRTSPELVACHVPCHLRAQNIGFRSRDLMRLIPGTTVKMVEECCGHDGTWAMRKEFPRFHCLAVRRHLTRCRRPLPKF